MTRLAVTGHMNLTAFTAKIVSQSLEALIATSPGGDMVGLSCIARGSDTLFADAILRAGGALEVFLPSPNYRQLKVKPADLDRFDRLLARASQVHVMPFETPDRRAYEAANDSLLSTCDRLVAVWDGQPAVDKGGTAALVEFALRRRIPVDRIWPPGAQRE